MVTEPTTFAGHEESRALGEPINLYRIEGVPPSLESMVRSVTIIPGATEFGYAVTRISLGPSNNRYPGNYRAGLPVSDFVASIEDLTAIFPNLEHVSLVVAWHGDDLRAQVCRIRPRVEYATTPSVIAGSNTSYPWRSGPVTRGAAWRTSRVPGTDDPALGGAPGDRTIHEALNFLRGKGLRATLYPFLMMDIEPGNTKIDPYGGTGQPAYPWRGRITSDPAPGMVPTADKTATAREQIDTFFGTAAAEHFNWNNTERAVAYSGPADEWSYRRFILHMATIAAETGVTDFLIGSEMPGLTTVRDDTGTYPAVSELVALAAEVRQLLPAARISYAADWSEYHSHRPGDGSGDVFFHLDPLWANENIDYIGIDAYFGISDWRNEPNHLDRAAGFTSPYDLDYLRAGIEGGENYDWYYASEEDREAQIRTPIHDGLAAKHWVWRQKDIRGWWENEHYNRPGGAEAPHPTEWVPRSKPIVFTEIGAPAVNLAANQPNVFLDAKSSENALPRHSNGRRDDLAQRSYLEAILGYWDPVAGNNPFSEIYGDRMIETESASVWTWDARPWPTFPNQIHYWSDGVNWSRGHWITGRVTAGRGWDAGLYGPYLFTDAEQPVVFEGETYKPVPITRSEVTSSGDADDGSLTVTIAAGEPIDFDFIATPPDQVLNLTVRRGHVGTALTRANFPVIWGGRITSVVFPASTIEITSEPITSSLRRPGLRRHYQIMCPHVLYGEGCRANRNRATVRRTVGIIDGNRISLTQGLPISGQKYVGGIIEWGFDTPRKHMRTIVRVEGPTIVIRGLTDGLYVGAPVAVSLGCNRSMEDCEQLHNNIHNYGGQPFIPLENPFAPVNRF